MNGAAGKRRFAWTAVLLAAVVLLLWLLYPAGYAEQEEPDRVKFLIGVSQPHLIEPWRVLMNEEIRTEVERHEEMKVIFTDAAGSSPQQLVDIQKLMGYGIDLLIISLDDPLLLSPEIARVYAQIPVIVLGRGVTGYDYSLYIGTDNHLIGSRAGAYARELLGAGGGRIVEIQGLSGSPTVGERSSGFRSALEGREGLAVVDTIAGDWYSDKAEDELYRLLQDGREMDLVFAHNDTMALGAYRALTRAGRPGVKIIGIDGANSRGGGIGLVKSGVLSGTFTSPAGGAAAVRYALDLLNREKGIPKKVILRSHPITPGSAAAYEERLARPADAPVREITPEHPIRVGFAQVGTESGWRAAHTKSMMAAAREEGIQLLYENADQQQDRQIAAIRRFIQERVDMIVVSPVVKTGWDEVLQEAKAVGIPVILSDREVETADESLWTAFIGSDFVEEGRRAARWLVQELGPETGPVEVVELQGTRDADPTLGRRRGFEEVLRDEGHFRIAASLQGDFTLETGRALMERYLQEHGSGVRVVFAHNDDMALGAAEAIEAYGLRPGKDILLISVDATKAALKALVTGKLNYVVECNPLLGPQTMKAVKDYMAGKELPMRIITSEGVFPQDIARRELANREY